MTHYETLGVTESATPDEIKKAYRKLASQHHPDKGGDTQKFQEIQTAYDILSSDEKRQMYDLERSGMGRPGGVHFNFHHGGPMDINEIFRNFGFGGHDPFEQARQQHQRKNKDLRIEIQVPLVTTLHEQTKTVSVQTTNGKRETVEVKIPRGVTSGTQMRYPNIGDNLFETLPRGDLYVQITVHGSEDYGVNGIDLYHQIEVNSLLPIIGGEVEVRGIEGNTFLLTIPKGTQPRTKFRVAHQGLYQMNSNNRGHLYVEMLVKTPTNLTDEQLQLIKTIITQ